jgi:hypothetical protein
MPTRGTLADGGTTANYAATLDWGDGSTTLGSITLSGSTFTVTGNHTYAAPGPFTMNTTVNHETVSANMHCPLTERAGLQGLAIADLQGLMQLDLEEELSAGP